MNLAQRMHFTSGGRYPVLRMIAILYLLLGVVSVLAGIVGILWILGRAPYPVMDRIILAAGAGVVTFFSCVLMLSAAEIVKLFVDLEHNTRLAAMTRPMYPAPSSEPAAPAHTNRISVLEEETAEAALIRGH